MTVHELSALYLNNHLVRRSSFETTKRLLRNTFGPINSFFVDTMTNRNVLEWHSHLHQTPHQANRALGVLRAMIRWGMRLQLCSIDPTHGVVRFPVSTRSRFLSQEELNNLLAVLASSPKNIALFVLLVLTTGCRRSEAREMKWCALDLLSRRWTKPRSKSGRWHIIPIPKQTITALHCFTHVNEWVFPGLRGKPWSLAGIEKAWGKVRKQCKLDDVRLHDLRRTAASHMAINGENLTTIQKMLDHSSLQATAIYARLDLVALDGALQRHADRIFPSDTLPPC